MKLINNRFKIKELVITEEFEEGYLVLDLSNNNKKCLLKLYDFEKNTNVIKYYIENFIEMSQVRHKNLLESYSFNRVESINLKKTNIPLYYTVAEYIERPVFRASELDLNLEETLKIILDLMSVIDFLHFRGYIYQYLNPITTFYSLDKSVKIVDLSTISEYKINSYYEDSIEGFTAPETFVDTKNNNYKSDYYSLGMMMKYLLTKNHLKETLDLNYKDKLNLNIEQEEFLTNTINNLTNKEPNLRDVKLRTHIDNIIKFFDLNYTYDLVEERSTFYSKTKIIGRDSELRRLLPTYSKYNSNDKNYDLAIISGNEGDGKTKVLNELSYKLKMMGRDVYFIDVKENSVNDVSNSVSLIKETFKNTSNEVLNKYSQEFSFLLPQLEEQDNKCLNSEAEKFKALNRLGHYFKEISKGNKIFIIIDNFHKTTDDFISVLDYIINNSDNNELSIIIGYETNYSIDNSLIHEAINRWKSYNTVIDIKLEKLNEEDIGKLTKSILGISYIPRRFSSILYKGSQGNPLYLDYIIKYLYNKGELYINNSGNWGLKTNDYSTLPIPSNINKAIEEQLNKIKDKDLIVLKTISIFNDQFTKQLLVNILDIDSNIIDISLNNLISERYIEKRDDSSYAIVTNGWQRIMYSRIDHEEKKYLHSKAAEVLIKKYGENTQLELEDVICHLEKANNNQKTLQFISNEWDKLDNKYGDRSIYLCEVAYKLVEDIHNETKLVYLDRLVDIYFIKGNIEKFKKYLQELLVESKYQKNIEFQIKAMIYQSTDFLTENKLERAYELADEIEKIARINGILEGIIESLIMKCKVIFNKENLSHMKNLLNEALELSITNNKENYLGTIYNLLGFVNHMDGNTEIAISNYKKSIEHFINSNNMLEATKPMNNLAEIYSVNHGNIDMALYYYKRGLEIANSYGFTRSSIIFLNNLGELYKNSADMHKALELFEESRKGALEIGDYSMTFLANANLGSLYITYNMMDKAYECFMLLEKEYELNPITETEILIQYNMFIGEYYEAFGELDLSIYYFLKVAEFCKGHNIRDYLRAKIKLVLIKYRKTNILNEFEVRTLIDELKEAKLFYDSQHFLLNLSVVLHYRQEVKLRNEFLKIFDKENEQNTLSLPIVTEFRKYLDLIIEDTEEALEKVEKALGNNEDPEQYNSNLYTYLALGKGYNSKGNYYKSTKNLLKALDLLYSISENIPQKDLHDKFVKTRYGDIIKKYIIQGLDKILDTNLIYNIDSRYELNRLISYLPDEIFNKIFYNRNNIENMESVQELISNLTEDYEENIDYILEYIGLITLADRGHIYMFDENTNEYISISSLLTGDTDIPNESILIQSNKSKLGLLLNKNMIDSDKSKYYHYLNRDSVGIICIPISIPLKSQAVIKDRRKRVYSSSQFNKGYIYLESYGSLNRFDFERLKIINSLSYLIYLNIENNNLKLISSVDKLTGVLTRKYFEQKLVEILKNLNKSNESFTILMLDIDNFKSINDTYGHLKGDEVLSQVAKTIKSSIRNTDLVGRYGGEEFIILLSDSTFTLGKNIAEKIRLSIENMKIPEINRRITVSIGISQYPNHSQFKDELINKADQALYYSKNFLGKNSSAIWSLEMGSSYNRIDKLAGILTGNTNLDNRNLLTILDMVDLGINNNTFKEKAYLFLGRTLDTIDGEYATLFLLEDDKTPTAYGSRIRLNAEWISTPIINMDKINDTINRGEGEYIIDWDDIENVSPLTGVPNWQSIMIIPLIKMDEIKGVLYITVPLDEREFDFDSFNITKLLCNIFASNL